MSSNASPLYDRVCELVAWTFEVDRASIAAETGVGKLEAWDSLGHLRLMMEIEAEFSVRFSTEQIGRPKTVAELCQLLNEVLEHG